MGKGSQRRKAVGHDELSQCHPRQEAGRSADGAGKEGKGRQEHQKKGLKKPTGQENVVGKGEGGIGKIGGSIKEREVIGKGQACRQKGSEKIE